MPGPGSLSTTRGLVRVAIAFLSGCALLLLLLLILTGSAQASRPASAEQVALRQDTSSVTRYVATTGVDHGDCSTPTSPCRTVQYAVDMARDGDLIKVASGTYTDVHLRAGGTQVVYISKTLTIQGGYTITNGFADPPDLDLHPTILDAQGQGRVLLITGTISVTVASLHITGGNSAGQASDPDGYRGGGGIYVRGGTISIRGSRIHSNTTGSGPAFGGGILVARSDATSLLDNVIYSNTATGDYGCGGGVFIRSSGHVTVVNNTVFGNRGEMGEAGACGGGVIVGDKECISGIISHNVISGNSAGGPWGGLGVECSNTLIDHNIIIANATEYYGGGLGIHASHNATISNNLIIGNSAGQEQKGGGILIESSSNVNLSNNVVADNQLADRGVGAGIYVHVSHCRFRHTTLAYNNGGDGSGVYVTGDPYSGKHSSVAMTNTILANHTVGITVAAGSTATLNGVLWYSNTTANIGGNGTITVTNEYTGNPAFVDPSGGDYHISPGSAAADRGMDTVVTNDIDGDPRPIGPAPDIGADELIIITWRQTHLPLVLRRFP